MAILNRVGVSGLLAQLDISDKRYAATYILGGPGLGKTVIPRQRAKRVRPDNAYWYMNCAGVQPEVFTGFMFSDQSHAEQRTCFLAKNEKWTFIKPGDTLHIDEVDKAPMQVQNVILELIQFNTINGEKVGDGRIHLVLSANTSDVKNGTFGVSTLGGNRARVLEFRPDPRESIEYLVQSGVHPLVSAFLNAEGNAHYVMPPFVPSAMLNATPRAWHEAGHDLNVLPDNASEDLIIQTLATRLPAEIVTLVQQHIHYYHKRIDWFNVSKDPDGCPIPGEADGDRGLMSMQLWYCASVVAQMKPEDGAPKSASNKYLDARHSLWRYAKRFPPEFVASVLPVIVGGDGGTPAFLMSDSNGMRELLAYTERRKAAMAGL